MFKKLFSKQKPKLSQKINSDVEIKNTDVDMVIEPSNYSSSVHTEGSANDNSPLKTNPRDDTKYNINILIVDDAKINRYVLRRYIMRLKKNISIMEAENGLDAITKVAENTFDIIFMDIKMMPINGIDATKEILKIHKNIPPLIIGVTGQVEQETVSIALNIGMKNILSKPVSISELHNIFNTFFPNLE